MASIAFNNGKAALLKEDMDLVTLKIMFMATSYVPNIDTHLYVSDISASRAVGATDVALAGVTITVNNTSDKVQVSCSTFNSGVVSVTTNAYVVYIDTGVASTSQILGYIELTDGTTTPKTFATVAGTLTVTIPATGFLTL